MLAELVLVPLLICSGAVQLPAPGVTAWVDGSARPGVSWSQEVTSRRTRWLLVEVEGPGSGVDLDLTVRGDGWRQRSATHLDREQLLLPLLPEEQLVIEVTSTAKAAFRLGVTPLEREGWLVPGDARRERLEGPARTRLLGVRRTERVPVVLGGEVELLLFNEEGALLSSAAARAEASTLLNPALGVPSCLALVRAPRNATARPFSVQVARAGAAPSSLERFLDRLGKTPAQRLVIDALAENPDFQRMRDYLERYPGGVPLRLLVVPGLRAHGIERFGTYSRGTLAINPTIAAHQTNPQELVDTLVHELVHAILSLPRAPGYPLAATVLDSSHDRRLRGLGGAPLKRGVHPEPFATYLESEYGPSASNPNEDYTDINAGAQRLIVKVIQNNLTRTGQGKQTLVFENALRREAQLAETK